MNTRLYGAVIPPVLGVARLPSNASPGELVVDETTTGQRAAIFGIVLFLIAAVVVSHQFTPLALIVILLALSAAGRTKLRSLWLFTVVLVFAWLSWEAKIYWAGHFREIFGAVGSISSSLNFECGRPAGQGPVGADRSPVRPVGGLAHHLVRRSTGVLCAVASGADPVDIGHRHGGSGVRRRRSQLRRGSRPADPVVQLGSGAILLAALLDTPKLRWPPIVACLVVVGVLVALFPVTRYGNEAFEAMAPGDVAAANWVHSHVPLDATVWVINGDNPLAAKGIQRYEEATLPGPSFTSEASYEKAISTVRNGDWIYLSRSQGEYGIYFQGDFPQDWIRDFAFWLVGSKEARIAYQTSTAYVLHVTVHKIVKRTP